MESTETDMDTSKAAAALGRKGGKAGTGEAKRRGDSDYYRALRAKRDYVFTHHFCEICGGDMGLMSLKAFNAAGRACSEHSTD